MNNRKGITLVTLTITILVLIILASVATYTGVETVQSAKYYNTIAQLKTMKTKVDELYEDYQNGDETIKTAILSQGTDTTSKSTELETAYYVASQNNINSEDLGNKEDYRYYTKDYIISTLDLDGIDKDFFVNIKTRSILLVQGTKYKNETYYSLCQVEGEQLSLSYIPTFKVYFDANGGILKKTSKVVSYGETYGELPTSTREGYTFLGWNGKNLLNPSTLTDFVMSHNYNSDIYVDQYGYLHDSTPNSDSRTWNYASCNWKLPLDAGSYTVLLDFIEPVSNKVYSGIRVYGEDNTLYKNKMDLINSNWFSVTFTLEESKNIGIMIKQFDGVYRIQLEKGNTATAFEPYYVTSDVTVNQTKSHTLTAIWEED